MSQQAVDAGRQRDPDILCAGVYICSQEVHVAADLIRCDLFEPAILVIVKIQVEAGYDVQLCKDGTPDMVQLHSFSGVHGPGASENDFAWNRICGTLADGYSAAAALF